MDGRLIVTPPLGLQHGEILFRLCAHLGAAIPGTAAHISPPGEIRSGDRTSLEPDILVCPARYPLKTPWRDVTERWLAIEVVSPSSRRYDPGEKRAASLALGVPSYWVVDPEARTVEIGLDALFAGVEGGD